MAIGLKLVNFDEMFNSITGEKFLVNNFDIFNNESKKVIDNYLMKNYSEDNISIIPSCSCGAIKGAYYIGDYCDQCNTHVKNTLEDNISFLLWVKKPDEVERFISPMVLSILLEKYKIAKPTLSIIQWLMLPGFKIDKRQQRVNLPAIDRLTTIFENYKIARGYNSFVQNIVNIVEILEKEFNKTKKIDTGMVDFIYNNREMYLSNYLPFPNKTIFTTESNEMGKFIDKNIIPCINVVRRLTGIDVHYRPPSVKQTRVATSLIDLAQFYVNYTKETFFSKNGLIRQHISSTRSHFTARAVATSIVEVHDYDEIHIPWSIACSLFREHILNKLLKRGYIYKNAVNLLLYHTRIHSPVLEEIFTELIRESNGGIKVFLNRNPSLHRGSILTVRITRIKNDVKDNTISISLLIVRPLNADFDGDEINLSLIYDKTVSDLSCNFEPHLNILGFDDVNGFTGNIAFPKPIVATISNWYKDGK